VGVNSDRDARKLAESIPALGKMGVNALVIEINYAFQFKSHPELNRPGNLTREQARALADLCRQNGIRPIPQINCLGHQSWAKHTGALLEAHPELDETPGKYPQNKGIYCRSGCPLNPETDKIPTDIVLCDWHYERQADYKSVSLLLGKGFRVWPCGWHDVAAAGALMDASIGEKNPCMVGYLSTTWGKAPLDKLADFPPTKLAVEKFGAGAKSKD
jgi:hypothetical protein